MKKLLLLLFVLVAARAVAQDTTRLSLLFLGDIMQHDSQITEAYVPSEKRYDYSPCFQFVKPYIERADLTIGNLELTLAGRPYKGYPQFSAPDELLTGLKEAGIDVLVTANNHCVDRGRQGLERTIDMLDSFAIPHTGTFKDAAEKTRLHPLLIEKNGLKLALLNYTFSTNGLPVYPPNIVNRIDTAQIGKDIQRAKRMEPDAVIVFTHWGVEYQSLPAPSQRIVTDYCFRKGAQLVIGAHPHVIQPMEWHQDANRLVAYSLGNFVSGQRKRYTDGGAMIEIELAKISNPDGVKTIISNASYLLQWVYRTQDAERNYYVLPVSFVEAQPEAVIKDTASVQAFKTFIKDSRALLGQHNKNIGESLKK